MDNIKNKIKSIQVRNIFSNSIDGIKRDLIKDYVTNSEDNLDIYNDEINDKLNIVDNYLLENELLINNFYNNNIHVNDNNNTCLNIINDKSKMENKEKEDILKIIDSTLIKIYMKKKEIDLKLYNKLNESFNPFLKILEKLYKIKLYINEIIEFLKNENNMDLSNNNNNLNCLKLLNKIILNIYRKERMKSILNYLLKLNELKEIQSNVQLLLNNKEYDNVINIINNSIDLLNNDMKGIKAVNTLLTQLYEIQNIVEKLSLQDFINIVLYWLKYDIINNKNELIYNNNNIEFSVIINKYNEFTKKMNNLNFMNNKKFGNYIINEFYKLNNINEEIYNELNINNIIYPIIALLKRGRINLAIDDLELQLNEYIDNINKIFLNNIYNKDLEEIDFIKINNNNEWILFQNIYIIYKLINFFTIIFILNKYLIENNEIPIEIINKSLKNNYLSIMQLLEQILERIFGIIFDTLNINNNKLKDYKLIINYSHLYYWTYIKYIIILIKIKEYFVNNVILLLYKDKMYNINFIEKSYGEIRVKLYNYYKDIFENYIFNTIWINLSIIIDNEKWDKKDLTLKYKETFQLFITGELNFQDSIVISNYNIIKYNDNEFILPLCCLNCIEYLNILFNYIKKVPIIFYIGINKIFYMILNYNIKCYNNIINGDSINNNSIEKITPYNIILCGQTIHFWIISLENIINYQLGILNNKINIIDEFISSNIYSLNNENNLNLLLGINLPNNYINNINNELKNILNRLEQLRDNCFKKISDIILDRFRNTIKRWIYNNNILVNEINENVLYDIKELIKNHNINSDLNIFMKDFNNLNKTLIKYLRINSFVINILNNIKKDCILIWNDYFNNILLLDDNNLKESKCLDYQEILFDLYYFHNEITISIFQKLEIKDNNNNDIINKNLTLLLLDILYNHYKNNHYKLNNNRIIWLNKIFDFIYNYIN